MVVTCFFFLSETVSVPPSPLYPSLSLSLNGSSVPWSWKILQCVMHKLIQFLLGLPPAFSLNVGFQYFLKLPTLDGMTEGTASPCVSGQLGFLWDASSGEDAAEPPSDPPKCLFMLKESSLHFTLHGLHLSWLDNCHFL